MKKLILVTGFIALIIIFNACEKNFLDRSPLDQVGSFDFFKSPADLKTYVNQFYTSTSFPISEEWGRDFDSDNAVGNNVNTWLEGSALLIRPGLLVLAE